MVKPAIREQQIPRRQIALLERERSIGRPSVDPIERGNRPVSTSSCTPHLRVTPPPVVALPQPRQVLVRASGKPNGCAVMDAHARKPLEDGQGHGIGGNDGLDAGENKLVEHVEVW